MNKLFAICLWCKFRVTDKRNNDRCIIFDINVNEGWESCDRGELSIWAIDKRYIKGESIEQGGVRESERFE